MSADPHLAVTTTTESPTRSKARLTALPGRLLGALPREGAFWVLVAAGAPKAVGPIVTIGLRRFLGPGASGIYDLAATPYNFLNNFRNFGTGPALVYERVVSRQIVNTAWTLNMIFSVLVTLVAQLIAHPVALYYHHPEVEGVFRVLSIAYVFASITSVHSFLLMRDFDFRARSIPAIGQVIVAGDIAVVFAIWGFGVGALVGRELTSVIMGAILLFAVYPYRPSPQFIPSIAWKLFRYGFWIGMGLTVLYMSQNVDVFIGGNVIHSASDIGFYTTSWKLAFIAASVFTLVASSMVFPSLSRLQDNFELLQRTLLGAIRQMGLIMFPAAALLASVAPVLIVPVLGEKYAPYRESFLVLSLLAVYAGNRTMLSVFFEAYKSIGKPEIVWIYNTIKLAVMAPAMYFGAKHGVLGLASTYIPIQLIEFPAALLLARRVLKVGPRAVWRAASVPVIATLTMAAATIGLELLLTRGLSLGDTLTLFACLPVGAFVYIACLFVLDRRIFGEGLKVLTRGF
ncbi:MAG TPA: lipopolysaccharide biosynthesis protein [Chloroflexota bacterium]|nr:lipopolysaccharide biosynthesis protein [Chloroflexota bacterium]